jgi:hypothetical protein
MTKKTICNILRRNYVASCKRKRKYSFVSAIFRFLNLKFKGSKVTIYKCIYCGNYHVGGKHRNTHKRFKRLSKIDFEQINIKIDNKRKLKVNFI